MTGYSFVEGRSDQFSFSVEIRTLNTKYNECFTNVPRFLRPEESEIQSILKKNFVRGKVELNLEVFDWVVQREVTFNRAMAEACYNELKNLEKSLQVEQPFSPDVIFQFDGVVNRTRTLLSAQSKEKIYDALHTAIDKVIAMRQKEGNALKKDIVHSLKAIKAGVKQIRSLSRFDSKAHYEKLKERITALSGSVPDERRLYTEIAFYADRVDVNEELCRLTDHLEKFDVLFSEEESVGKKLDFLAQELFREINTIGSKTASSQVSHIVVDLKNHVDRIREQGRNLV